MDTFQLKGHESKLCLSGLRTKEVGGLRKPLMVTLLLLLTQSATTTVFLLLLLPATQRRIEMSLQVFFFQTLCQRNVRYEKGKLDST